MRTPRLWQSRLWRGRLWQSRLWQSRLWQSLPYDGQGLFPSPTGVFADLRQSAAAVFWRRVPWWSRPLLIPLARLGWVVACAGHVWSYPPGRTLRLFLDCLQSGARPNEAWIWRQVFLLPGVHPLPGRAAGRLLATLGAAAEHSLLSDKLATGEMLRLAGLAVPTLLGVIRPGTGLAADVPAWTYPGQLFIKPRNGSGGRGARVIQDAASLPADVSRDTLVQPLLSGPVLRLTTARNPGEAPFLHSAFLAFDVPGENPRNFIRGQIRVPVHPRTALMGAGIWFLHPGKKYQALPWNQAPLAGGGRTGFPQGRRNDATGDGALAGAAAGELGLDADTRGADYSGGQHLRRLDLNQPLCHPGIGYAKPGAPVTPLGGCEFGN